MLEKHRNIPLRIFLLVVSRWSPFFRSFTFKPLLTRGGVHYESKTHIFHNLRASHFQKTRERERDELHTDAMKLVFPQKDVFCFFPFLFLYFAALVSCVYIHTFPACNCLTVTCQTLPKATVGLAN
jgi:hypothetical protein